MLPALTHCDPGDETDHVEGHLVHSAEASVEQIERRIAALQIERQALRTGPTRCPLSALAGLELNRLALVRAQQELSRALIARHSA